MPFWAACVGCSWSVGPKSPQARTPRRWARGEGSPRAADASVPRVHQHCGGTGERRRADPPWQPSLATVDNQCGFGFVNIIETFQGCDVLPESACFSGRLACGLCVLSGGDCMWGACVKEQLVRLNAWRLETESFLSSFVSVFLYYPHKKKYMGAGPSGEWAAHLAAGVPASQSFSSPLVLHSSGSSCALCHLCTIFSWWIRLRRYHKLIPSRWLSKIL